MAIGNCVKACANKAKQFFMLSSTNNCEQSKSAVNLLLIAIVLVRVLMIAVIITCATIGNYVSTITWYIIPCAIVCVVALIVLLAPAISYNIKRIVTLTVFQMVYLVDYDALTYFSMKSHLCIFIAGYSGLHALVDVYTIGKMYIITTRKLLFCAYFITRLLFTSNDNSSKIEFISTVLSTCIASIFITYIITIERIVKIKYQLESNNTLKNWKNTMESCNSGHLLMQNDSVYYINPVLTDLFNQFRNCSSQKCSEILTTLEATAKTVSSKSDHIEYKHFTHHDQTYEWKVLKVTQNGKPTCIHTFTDITTADCREQCLNERKYVDMLVATSTHELRTPLNGIKSFILFALPTCSEEGKSLLQRAISACELQESLINDIMDYAKIQKEKIIISNEHISINKLMQNCYEIFEFQAKEKGITLDIKIKEGTPEYITGDLRRIKQILLNLISNSIKFTFKGGIILEAKQSKNKIHFSVIDTGIGITDDDLQKLFKPFVMINSSNKLNKNGTGLGLNLCKKLSQRLGGDIKAKSVINSGTIFRFSLPYLNIAKLESSLNIKIINEESPTQYESTVNTLCTLRADWKSQRKQKILIVDDTPFNIEAAHKLLKQLNYDTVKAFSGIQAIDIVKDASINIGIAFIDLHMPNMDGYELCASIRRLVKDKVINKFPMIALTADDKENVQSQCISKGFCDILSKPLSMNSIKLALEKHFS